MKRFHLNQIPDFKNLLKSYFFAGVLVVIPLGVIAWILAAVLRALWGIHEILPDAWQPENYITDPGLVKLVNFAFVVAAVLVLATGVSVLGWVSRQYLGKKALEFFATEIIQRIPVVRSIYGALDQLLHTLAAGGGQQFNRVVYIEYPRKGTLALAFVTGAARGKNIPEGYLNVYIPTTPNPTSGFHLIVLESEVRESGMSVEQAFKTILSLGIAQ